jgi:hypothetical protein
MSDDRDQDAERTDDRPEHCLRMVLYKRQGHRYHAMHYIDYVQLISGSAPVSGPQPGDDHDERHGGDPEGVFHHPGGQHRHV